MAPATGTSPSVSPTWTPSTRVSRRRGSRRTTSRNSATVNCSSHAFFSCRIPTVTRSRYCSGTATTSKAHHRWFSAYTGGDRNVDTDPIKPGRQAGAQPATVSKRHRLHHRHLVGEFVCAYRSRPESRVGAGAEEPRRAHRSGPADADPAHFPPR